jgi:hypothetical protein
MARRALGGLTVAPLMAGGRAVRAEGAPAEAAAGRGGGGGEAGTEVAAYYFPNYHRDPRSDVWYGPGWTEWELVKAARPRFPGHRQPIEPAWGHFDEADPAWAARQIDLAADHGLTAFLFDWYWYEDGPYLHAALERGFLAAPNRSRLKFALMWANHDWLHVQPAVVGAPPRLLMPGAVSPAGFERLIDHVLERYLTQPNYLRLAGEPYFSIYDTATFVAGMGGLPAARAALDRFRDRVRAAGFPGLHLNAIVWGLREASGAGAGGLPETVTTAVELGLSSVGTYTWIHHYDPSADGFPRASYERVAAACRQWREHCRRLPLPYHPNVSMGWDSTPRTVPTDRLDPIGYPWLAVLEGNTPESFRAALRDARAEVEREAAPARLVTLNAWNEWTEGSYLLPDTRNGTAYLEAVRDVFGTAPVTGPA